MNMNFKKKNCLVLLIVVALVTSLSSGKSYFLRDFGVGDTVVFGISEYTQYKAENHLNDLVSTTTLTDDSEVMFEFTGIDDIALEYTAERTYAYGPSTEITRNFESELYSISLVAALFHFDYDWDEDQNRIVLDQFLINYNIFHYFNEPDWDVFNTIFKEIINPDRIIDTVDHDSVTEFVTFGDFLDDIHSYKIMGSSNISKDSNLILNSTTSWSFEFDLDHSIYQETYNPISYTTEYRSLPKYQTSFNFEYSEGGTLEILDYQLVTGDEVDNSTFTLEERHTVQNGGLEAIKTNFSFYSVVFSLAIIPISLLIQKRKKN